MTTSPPHAPARLLPPPLLLLSLCLAPLGGCAEDSGRAMTGESSDFSIAGPDLAAPACVCTHPLRCVDGACQQANQLQLLLVEDGRELTQHHALALTLRPRGASDLGGWTSPNGPAIEEGDCTAHLYNPMTAQFAPILYESFCGDAGTITIEGGVEPISLTRSCAVGGSYTSASAIVLFPSEARLHVSSTGGKHFPPLSLDLVMPTALDYPDRTVTAGQPATITWTPGNGERMYLGLIATSPDRTQALTIECIANDSGHVTIPARLTSLAPAGAKGTLTLMRRRELQVEPPDTLTVVDVALQSIRRYDLQF